MQLPEEKLSAIRDAIYGGASRKIEAVKLVRDATGCGLKDAKDFVEKTAAELFAKEPQKFSAPPSSSRGCAGVLVTGILAAAGVGVALKIFI